MSTKEIKVDPANVKAIRSWPIPRKISEIWGFHKLASLYRQYVQNFSSLIAPITECIMGGLFRKTPEAE